jgi:rod shape-determining protein MreC
MKFLKSKFFVVSATIAIILVLIPSVLSVFGYTGLVRSILKTAAKPFEWCGTQVAGAVNGFVSVFSDYDEIKAENEELRARLAELENAEYEASVMREQNAWLKNYLDLKSNNPSVILTDATIISREAGSYATVLTINKGKLHGLKRQMPVISNEGIFGYVSEVGLDWAKVVSIIETASSVGVYTERGGVTGVVEGDSTLRQNGSCVMTYISPNADIKVGDRVFTSGGGSVYPSGLLVGEITAISADEATRTLRAVVTPSVDFSDVDEITKLVVIIGYKTAGGN